MANGGIQEAKAAAGERPAPRGDQEVESPIVSASIGPMTSGVSDDPLQGHGDGFCAELDNVVMDSSGRIRPEPGSRMLRGAGGTETRTVAGKRVNFRTQGRVLTCDGQALLTSVPVTGMFDFNDVLVSVLGGRSAGRMRFRAGTGSFSSVRTTGRSAVHRWFTGTRFTTAEINNEMVICSGELERPVRLHFPRPNEVSAHWLGIPEPTVSDVTQGTLAQTPRTWFYYFVYSRSFFSDGAEKEEFGPTRQLEVKEKAGQTVHTFRETVFPDPRHGLLRLRVFRTAANKRTGIWEINATQTASDLPSRPDGTFPFQPDAVAPVVNRSGWGGIRHLRSAQSSKFQVALSFLDGLGVRVALILSSPARSPSKRFSLTPTGGEGLPAAIFLIAVGGGVHRMFLAVQGTLPKAHLSVSTADPAGRPDSLGYAERGAAADTLTASTSTLGGTGAVSLFEWDLTERQVADLALRIGAWPEVVLSGAADARRFSGEDFLSWRLDATYYAGIALGKGTAGFNTDAGPPSKPFPNVHYYPLRHVLTDTGSFELRSDPAPPSIEITKDGANVPCALVTGPAAQGTGDLRNLGGATPAFVHWRDWSTARPVTVDYVRYGTVEGRDDKALIVSLDTPGIQRRTVQQYQRPYDNIPTALNNRNLVFYKDNVYRQASLSGTIFRDGDQLRIVHLALHTEVPIGANPTITFQIPGQNARSATFTIGLTHPGRHTSGSFLYGRRWLPPGYTRYYANTGTTSGFASFRFTYTSNDPFLPFWSTDLQNLFTGMDIHITGLPSNVFLGLLYGGQATSLAPAAAGRVQLLAKEDLGTLTMTVGGTALKAHGEETETGATAQAPRPSPAYPSTEKGGFIPGDSAYARLLEPGKDAVAAPARAWTWDVDPADFDSPASKTLFPPVGSDASTARTLKITSSLPGVVIKWVKDADVAAPHPWDLRPPSVAFKTQTIGSGDLPVGDHQDNIDVNTDETLPTNDESQRLYTEKAGWIPNDEPPEARVVESAGGRIFLGNVRQDGDPISNRVAYSNLQPTGPAIYGFRGGQILQVDRPITAMKKSMNNLIIFTKNAVHRVEGLAGRGLGLYELENVHGCPSVQGAVDTPMGLVYASDEGCFILRGGHPLRLSDHFSAHWGKILHKGRITAVLDPVEQRVHFHYDPFTDGAIQGYTAAVVLDLRRSRLANDGGWFATHSWNYPRTWGIHPLCWCWHRGIMHRGNFGGTISYEVPRLRTHERLGRGTYGSPIPAPIDFTILSAGIDFGNPGVVKSSARLVTTAQFLSSGGLEMCVVPNGAKRVHGGYVASAWDGSALLGQLPYVTSKQASVLGVRRQANEFQVCIRPGQTKSTVLAVGFSASLDVRRQRVDLFFDDDKLREAGCDEYIRIPEHNGETAQERWNRIVRLNGRRPRIPPFFFLNGGWEFIVDQMCDDAHERLFYGPPRKIFGFQDRGKAGFAIYIHRSFDLAWKKPPLPANRTVIGTGRLVQRRTPIFTLLDCTLHGALTGAARDPAVVGE